MLYFGIKKEWLEKSLNTFSLAANILKSRLLFKGLVTHKRKSLDADLRLIAKNSFCLFDLLLYGPVNSCCHVETLAIERDLRL